MKKKFLGLIILCLFCTLLLAGCKNKEQDETINNPNYNAENYLSGKHYVQMDISNYGSVVLELDADAAPATVTNFINLVQNEFYNGLTFHRIIESFMMQGGDPEGTGLGGSEHTVPGEFILNGYSNPISHLRGTISMARAKDYNSASSQFFIVHQDCTGLDGSYAAFGKVIHGMDVVDKICSSVTPVVTDDDGTVPAMYQPIIDFMYILSEEEAAGFIPEEPVELPAPEATISFTAVSSTEGLDFVNTWNIHEDGQNYVLFSSADLVRVGLYYTDLSDGIAYDANAPLGYYTTLNANEHILVKFNVTEDVFPSIILVAEEPSGAIGQYLLSYDSRIGGAYLVPILN